MVRVGTDGLIAGKIDPLLRLYQQTGYLRKGPFVDDSVLYHPEEWEAIQQWTDWIEVVHGDNIWRITKRGARSNARRGTTGFLVPLSAYTRGDMAKVLRGMDCLDCGEDAGGIAADDRGKYDPYLCAECAFA